MSSDRPDVGILGILRGALATKPYAETLSLTVLGVALGSRVDLGYSDEVILSMCKQVLGQIRGALSNKEIVHQATDLAERIKSG